jgi:DNA polymerase sigma
LKKKNEQSRETDKVEYKTQNEDKEKKHNTEAKKGNTRERLYVQLKTRSAVLESDCLNFLFEVFQVQGCCCGLW